MTRQKSLIGYCFLCFKEVYDGQRYIVDGIDIFHKQCYDIFDPDNDRIEQHDAITE